MKKISLIILCLIFTLSTVNAQKGINYRRVYPGGGKLQMFVDRAAGNVFYSIVYPNQPNTSFNYLPDANEVSITINFRKNINITNYVYSILKDDKPFVINSPI